MTRAHFVKKARKANKALGIKKGESYWWWAFRRGGKHVSKTAPRPSQLTQSEFLSALYSAQENLQDRMAEVDAAVESKTCSVTHLNRLIEAMRELTQEVDNQRDECEEKKSNIEERFPNGNPTTELLEERISNCEQIHSGADDLLSEMEQAVAYLPHLRLPATWYPGLGLLRPDLSNHVLLEFDTTKHPLKPKVIEPEVSPKLKKGKWYLSLGNNFSHLAVPATPYSDRERKKKDDPPPPPDIPVDQKIMEELWLEMKESIESFLDSEMSCL